MSPKPVWKVLFTLAVLSTTVTPAGAAVVKVGKNFGTNSCRCAQGRATVAGKPGGGFIIGWQGFAVTDSKAVVRRSFDQQGQPIGDPATVNAATKFTGEFELDLASGGPGGRFVGVWSTSDTSSDRDVLVRRLSSAGAPLGPAFAAAAEDAAAPTSETLPSVAMGPDGGFAVAWVSTPLPGLGFDPGPPSIRLRRFDATGRPLGGATEVSSGPIYAQRPEVCIDPSNGSAVVAWASAKEGRPFEKTPVGVSLRRVSDTGAFLGGKTTVAEPALASADFGLSCSPKGGFVVAWEHAEVPSSWLGNPPASEVFAARYDRQGRQLGDSFVAPSEPGGDKLRPRVSHDSEGNFVIVWQDTTESTFTIEGRRFLADGGADTPDFEVIARPRTGQRIIFPDVAHHGTNGEFVVVFEKQSVVNGQRFKVE